MKKDADLQRDVIAELAWDPRVESNAIGVAVRDGVVTLTGHLDSFAEKHAAARAARRVSGVQAIAVELDVKLAHDHQRNDTEIALGIEQALRWNTMVPTSTVRVSVDHGWVNLQGEVDWDYERRAVEGAIRPLRGVVGISNELTVRPSIKVADVSQRIEDALKRQAIREAQHIRVSVEDSTVKLTGSVNSAKERDAVQLIAWSAPGVRAVVNELRVD